MGQIDIVKIIIIRYYQKLIINYEYYHKDRK